MVKLVIHILVKVIPIVGDALENKHSEDGGKGNFQWSKFIVQLLRVAGTIGASQFIN